MTKITALLALALSACSGAPGTEEFQLSAEPEPVATAHQASGNAQDAGNATSVPGPVAAPSADPQADSVPEPTSYESGCSTIPVYGPGECDCDAKIRSVCGDWSERIDGECHTHTFCLTHKAGESHGLPEAKFGPCSEQDYRGRCQPQPQR